MGRVHLLAGTSLVEPIGVEGPVGTSEKETNAARGAVGVHNTYGGLDLRIRDVSARQGSGLVDHMPCKTNGCQFNHNETKRSEV